MMVRQGASKGPDKTTRSQKKFGTICSAILLAGVLQVTGIPGSGYFGGFDEANAQRERREKPKTRASNTVSKKVGEGLTEALAALEAENYAEALSILNRLLQDDGLKPYERALILRTKGYVYAGQGNYTQAIQQFEQVERLNALDEAGQADLLFILGQLYLAEDRVDDSIRTLERWFAQAGDSAGPQAYFVLAQAYAIKEDYRRALELAEQGLAKSRLIEGQKPRENWYRFTAGMYYQNQKIQEMRTLLREMVGLFPGRPEFWSQLSATYSLLNDEDTAYYMRTMMYIQDLFRKSSDYVNLAQVHIFQETPIRGAKVLEDGFTRTYVDEEDGKTKRVVVRNADNYETLSIAYQEAREWKKSIPPLETAAKLSEDGDLYIRLCQAHLYDREYAKAEQACVQGINKGDLREPGQAWLLLGTTRYSRDKLSQAREAFVNAARYDKTVKNAQRWIRFLDQEIQRAAATG